MTRKKQRSEKIEVPSTFKYKGLPLNVRVWRKVSDWCADQIPLMEALCVAVTFHVMLVPVIWIAGWALPWPRAPVRTTVIEINLENWPDDARPERISEIYSKALREHQQRLREHR